MIISFSKNPFPKKIYSNFYNKGRYRYLFNQKAYVLCYRHTTETKGMRPIKTIRYNPALKESVYKNILQKKNLSKVCSNYLLLLQLYNEKKAQVNTKTARIPASSKLITRTVIRKKEETSFFQHTLLLLLNTKTYLWKTVRQSFSFLN